MSLNEVIELLWFVVPNGRFGGGVAIVEGDPLLSVLL